MAFIKNIREKDRDCSRCHKPLGIRNHIPDGIWEFEGKLCHSCFESVRNGVMTYKVTYVGGYSKIPVKADGLLVLLLFDKKNKIIFQYKLKHKDRYSTYLVFESKEIKDCRIMSSSEESLKKKIMTAGLLSTTETRFLQIDFHEQGRKESLILDVGKALDEVRTIIGLIIGTIPMINDGKVIEGQNIYPSTSELRELAPQVAQRPCMTCLKNNYSIFLKSQNLCRECFQIEYGRLILSSNIASYYGGHNAFSAGAMFSKEEIGNLYLTETHMIFAKRDNDPEKRWQITISLKSINIEGYTVEEKARRQQANRLGASPMYGVFGGTGFIHESGKEHHLVVPYNDENGIPQAPRFGVTSFRGKAIREWAGVLYEQIVKIRKTLKTSILEPVESIEKQSSQKLISSQIKDSPLTILKTRLAKGEITKEEYEELRKILED